MNKTTEKRLFPLIIYLFFLLSVLIYINKPKSDEKILGNQKIIQKIQVSAQIGRPSQIILYGYTSPFANVSLQGITAFSSTFSKQDGYFQFINFPITNKDKEICLSSTDNFGRTTPLVCIDLPQSSQSKKFGPIILPPTISLNKDIFTEKDEIIISGQTIPNTTVTLKFFEEKKALNLGLISSVFAEEKANEVSTTTDANGNFSIAAKTNGKKKINIYSYALFDNFPSPQSFKLSIEIWGLLEFFLLYLKTISSFIRKYLIDIIGLSEALIVIFFILRMRQAKKPKSLAIYNPYWKSIQKLRK